jgi:hypothetical protein
MPSKCEVLSSNTSTAEKERKDAKRGSIQVEKRRNKVEGSLKDWHDIKGSSRCMAKTRTLSLN